MRTLEDNVDVVARRVRYYKKRSRSELPQLVVRCSRMDELAAGLAHIDCDAPGLKRARAAAAVSPLAHPGLCLVRCGCPAAARSYSRRVAPLQT